MFLEQAHAHTYTRARTHTLTAAQDRRFGGSSSVYGFLCIIMESVFQHSRHLEYHRRILSHISVSLLLTATLSLFLFSPPHTSKCMVEQSLQILPTQPGQTLISVTVAQMLHGSIVFCI